MDWSLLSAEELELRGLLEVHWKDGKIVVVERNPDRCRELRQLIMEDEGAMDEDNRRWAERDRGSA